MRSRKRFVSNDTNAGSNNGNDDHHDDSCIDACSVSTHVINA
jgi:hypothetical protein